MSEPICPPLELRNGVTIRDPFGQAVYFIEVDGTYRTYDLAPVAADDVLIERDVRTANRIIARIPGRVVGLILERGDRIGEALGQIPANSSLVGPDADVPWEGLRRLFSAFDGVPEVGLPRITKILHKKRQALIPILDSVVEAYLRSVENIAGRTMAERAVSLVRAYKHEMDGCVEVLQCVRAELERRDLFLTECRLLDIYFWAFSGVYTPLWSQPSRAPRQVPSLRSPSPPAQALAEPADPRVLAFRDAEAQYLEWVASHPHGFVANTTRNPTPGYLVLHEATCPYISGARFRNFTTTEYMKFCSESQEALAAWARGEIGGPLRPCKACHPSIGQGDEGSVIGRPWTADQ